MLWLPMANMVIYMYHSHRSCWQKYSHSDKTFDWKQKQFKTFLCRLRFICEGIPTNWNCMIQFCKSKTCVHNSPTNKNNHRKNNVLGPALVIAAFIIIHCAPRAQPLHSQITTLLRRKEEQYNDRIWARQLGTQSKCSDYESGELLALTINHSERH